MNDPRDFTNFNCTDCKVDTNEIKEYYSLENEVWFSVAVKNEMLCIGCVEKRLGRELTKDDFRQCLLNSEMFRSQRSERLNQRLGGSAVPK